MKKCSICNAKVKKFVVKEIYEYKGKILKIELPVFRCTKCGEEFIDEKIINPINNLINKTYKKVNQ